MQPGDCHVMVRLADSMRKLGDVEGAKRAYERALQTGGNEKFASLGLGNLYYKSGDDEQALKALHRYLDFDPDSVIVLTMVGNIHHRRKAFSEAAVFFERALAVDAENVFAMCGLANCLRGSNHLPEAVALWERVLLQEPENQNVLSRLGDAMFKLDRLDRAEDYYRRSLAGNFDLYSMLGLTNLLRHRGLLEQAEQHCLRMLEDAPDNARVLRLLCTVYEDMGEWDKADAIEERLEDGSQ